MTADLPSSWFMSQVRKQWDGCWKWEGPVSRRAKSDPYGSVHYQGRTQGAHRVAWMLLRGPIPDGLVIDHLCRIKLCVNPDHLEVVTHQTNVLRGTGPSAVNARKVACPQGHAYTPENTYHRPSTGRRECRECNRLRHRRAAA